MQSIAFILTVVTRNGWIWCARTA